MNDKTKPTLVESDPTQITQDEPEEEAEDERLWKEDFAANKDIIAAMAAQAREERRLGRTIPIEQALRKNLPANFMPSNHV